MARNTTTTRKATAAATKAGVAEKATAPKKFAQDEPILCKSVTYGELILPGKKSQLLYTWANYGDYTEVEYQDLQALRSMRSDYLRKPYFIIENEELLAQWADVRSAYEAAMRLDIENLFTLPITQFRARLSEAPAGARDAIRDAANSMILSGELDSIKKINAIDEIFGTELKLLINT